LTKKLEKNVFVSIGRMAFLPGTLDHTNEFYTLVGDNTVIKKSSFRTLELLGRRKKCEYSECILLFAF
jgi:prefoldin subunit 5